MTKAETVAGVWEEARRVCEMMEGSRMVRSFEAEAARIERPGTGEEERRRVRDATRKRRRLERTSRWKCLEKDKSVSVTALGINA
jgi:hypothetical protein